MINSPYSSIKRFNLDKIQISRVNTFLTLEIIEKAIVNNKNGYICVTNARTAYLANHDAKYCKVQNDSLLTVPDGMPLVWIANNLGFNEVQKVSGKDLMDAIFKISVDKGYSHYFYGCSQNTIDLLQKKLLEEYPGLEIKGAVSPPFQPIEAYDIDHLSEEVNNINPTFFWCGLGAPKQEMLMALLQPKLDETICVGVGLAFEYFAGTVKRAPKWSRKLGLEGFVRLFQQPDRIDFQLVNRYVYIIREIVKSGIK